MEEELFTGQDIRQIRNHGLSPDEVKRHIRFFEKPPPFLNLVGPCTLGNGIKIVPDEEIKHLTALCESEAEKSRYLKFVPASGAATRMFKTLFQYLNQDGEVTKQRIVRPAQKGRSEAREMLKFMEGIHKFAFFKELKSMMSEKGFNADELVKKGRFTEIIRYLLKESGMNYGGLPKALIKFHDYEHKARTAFEEHLVEAASYVCDNKGKSLLHLTVSKEHLQAFEAVIEKAIPYYQEGFGVLFDVRFSQQKKSTDTLAVDLQNRPFRQENGQLLFRPGGHGALIENLNDLRGDILFIKNIDNVVPDRLKPETIKWKKILCGYLIRLQRKIFSYVEDLLSGVKDELLLEHVTGFLKEDLCVNIPDSVLGSSLETKRSFFLEKLNRPLRICGMVKSEGEPGGGPFWVRDTANETSLQIVEEAQIDPGSEKQQAIVRASTHFNPVDLVCGVRDHRGRPFDLRRYVDQEAVFISNKSKDGKELKALEHPGLWNGGMAGWNTLFVEVPAVTFNPVKTVNDLLREEHQPG